MPGRITRPLRVAAAMVSCVWLAGAAGCTAKGEDRAGPPASSAPAPSTTGGSRARLSPLERYLDLPIAKYAFTPQEDHVISLAEGHLVDVCMRKYGLRYRAQDAGTPAAYQPGTNRRYGVLNADVAAHYGYHYPEPASAPSGPQMSQKELVALNGRPNDTVELNGRKVPEGGCLGTARADVRGRYTYAKGAEVARTIATRSFIESLRKPAVVRAVGAWSRCMKGRGFSYPDPLKALGAPENSGERVTPREISVAKADVDCKESTGLVKIWNAQEAAIQRSMIEKNRRALVLLAASHRKIVSEARSIAGQGK